MITGYPLSDPPRWCETGCALSRNGVCTIPDRAMRAGSQQTVAGREWERRLAEQQRWDNAHEWDQGQPVHGILYDCPCYQETR